MSAIHIHVAVQSLLTLISRLTVETSLNALKGHHNCLNRSLAWGQPLGQESKTLGTPQVIYSLFKL